MGTVGPFWSWRTICVGSCWAKMPQWNRWPRAIRRGRLGLKDGRRPTGCFLLLGPSGVGKTQLCRALAAVLFGSQDALIRFDMSEYMEPHSVSRLIGSPPGLCGP